MKNEQHLTEFLSRLEESLTSGFIKMTLGAYAGDDAALKNIHMRKITLKDGDKISLTYRYRTRDIVKNLTQADAVAYIRTTLGRDWHSAVLHTESADHAYQLKKNGKSFVSRAKPSMQADDNSTHNRSKHRMIDTTGKSYLRDLGITDDAGRVLKNAQDKFRQIDKYVEILGGLLRDMQDIGKVTDMGSGKGYLTFALYDYLQQQRGTAVPVTGVEYRRDLVDLCNRIAGDAGFTQLSFAQGSIQDIDSTGTDVMIALHACDTATDDAIHKGIAAQSRLIVVAPCCHKQIRRDMEQGEIAEDIGFMTRHGTYLERHAEMATDGIRALILEHAGYDTKLFEFISDAHTPKNVMITARFNPKKKGHQAETLEKIRRAKAFYGIRTHYLETLTGLS